MVAFRYAHEEDVTRFFGRPTPFTLRRAHVAEQDGELLALFGVYRSEGKQCVFSELKEDAFKYRKQIFKTAKEFVRGLPTGVYYAVADERMSTADRFLRRLGFEPDMNLYRIEVK